MENYREKLKIHNILYGIGALALLAIQVLAFTGIVSPVGADERWHSFYNGFIAGAAFGVMALFIVGLILNLRALRSEKAMKKQYIKETDERRRQIAVMGKSAGDIAFYAYIVPFLISTAAGAVISAALIYSLKQAGLLHKMQRTLEV